MQVRVFESPDMASGLKLVRKELGPDALILSTRTVRNGKLGLLGKPTIEITAAIDAPWPDEQAKTAPTGQNGSAAAPARGLKSAKPEPVRKNRPFQATVGTGAGDEIAVDYSEKALLGNSDPYAQSPGQSAQRSAPSFTPADSGSAIHDEVDELRSIVKQLRGELQNEKQVTHPAEPQEKVPPANINQALHQRLNSIQQGMAPVTRLLEECGIDDKNSTTIANFAMEQLGAANISDSGKLRRFMARTIESLIEVKPPLFDQQLHTYEQSRIAFVGPTGVGKTTTLAKLAAHYLSNHSNSIALITIDTYRIAAVEQLKVYGEIMKLPVDVVISPEQLRASLLRHQDKELILIDTAGRSPRDSLCIQELVGFFPPDLGIEKHLVLSAATRESELLDTIRHFEKIDIDRTIYTKIDECLRAGAILNVQVQNKAPLSYITNGQRVPEDLLQITRRSVAELILSHHQGLSHDS